LSVEQLHVLFLLDNFKEELQKVVCVFKMPSWSSVFLLSNGSSARWYPLFQKTANVFWCKIDLGQCASPDGLTASDAVYCT